MGPCGLDDRVLAVDTPTDALILPVDTEY